MPYGFDECPECGSARLQACRHIGDTVICFDCKHVLCAEVDWKTVQDENTKTKSAEVISACDTLIKHCFDDGKCKFCGEQLDYDNQLKGHKRKCIVTEALVNKTYEENNNLKSKGVRNG